MLVSAGDISLIQQNLFNLNYNNKQSIITGSGFTLTKKTIWNIL